MTAHAATIQTTSRSDAPSVPGAASRERAGGGVESAAFAELLAVTGATVAPQGNARRASASRGAEDARETRERGEKEKTRDREGAAGTPANVGVSDAPLTIRALNKQLLRDSGTRSAGGGAPPDAASPSAGEATRGAGAAGRDSEGRAGGATSAPEGTASPRGAPAVEPGAAKALSGTEVAGAAAGREQASAPAQGAAQRVNPASAATAAVVTAVSPTATLKSLGSAAVRELAVAARSHGGTVGPTAVVGVGGAQGSRVDGRFARAAGGFAPGAAAESKAEVFRAQVARGIAAALEKGNGTLTMRLKPEALGRLNVKVSMKEGVLTAQFQAQSREARDLLVSTAADLKRALEAVGVTVERIEATVAPEAPAANSGDGGTAGDAAGGEWRGAEQDGTRGGAGGDSGEREGRTPERGGRVGEDAEHALDDGTTDWITLGLDTIA